nr:hypothetical protein [Tanacetum cinerariifolium]
MEMGYLYLDITCDVWGFFHGPGLGLLGLSLDIRDREDLDKLKPKADIGIFVGYALAKKAFRIYNKRTCLIIKTNHVDFDELTSMASKQFSLGLRPKLMTPRTISSRLVQNIPSPTPYVPPTKNEWATLFQPMFEALTESCWIKSVQEELNEFERLEVWELVPHSGRVKIITLKWIYKVKLDELGGMLKNKAHLVARGYRQEEGIDFEKYFAPIARLNDIRIFIAFTTHMNMIVYQIDVKNTFLNGILCEEVYERRKRHITDVDDGQTIILSWTTNFSESQRHLLKQSKYALELLKKYGMKTCGPIDTPMVEKSKLDKDPQRKAVDPTRYRGMIDTLMYLTSTIPDLVFAMCMCARYS